jgi:hypothetical protein
VTESTAEVPEGPESPDDNTDPEQSSAVPQEPGVEVLDGPAQVDEGLDLSEGDAEAVEALQAALNLLHTDQFEDIVEAVRAVAAAERLRLSTPEGVQAAFAQVIAELQARGVRVDGRPITGPLDVLGWIARGIDAVDRGEEYFDLDPGQTGAARMFWDGDLIDPETRQYVAADPGAPAGDDNRLSNKHFATVVSSKLWQEGQPATPVESTPDGRLIDKLGLGSRAVGDYLSNMFETLEESGAAAADMSLLWRIGGGGGGGGDRKAKPAANKFGDVTRQALFTQYGFQASEAISASRRSGAAAPAVGMVTQGVAGASGYQSRVASALQPYAQSVVYGGAAAAGTGARVAPGGAAPAGTAATAGSAGAGVARAGAAVPQAGAAAVAGAEAGVAGVSAAGAGSAAAAGAGAAGAGAVGAGAGAAGTAGAGAAGVAGAVGAVEEGEQQSFLARLWNRDKTADPTATESAAAVTGATQGEKPEPPVKAGFRGNAAAAVDPVESPEARPASRPTAEPPAASFPLEELPPIEVDDAPPIDLRTPGESAPSSAAQPVVPSKPHGHPQPPSASPVVPPPALPPAGPPAGSSAPSGRAQPAPPLRPPAGPSGWPSPPPEAAPKPADELAMPPLPARPAAPPSGGLEPLPAADAQRARDLLDRARKMREQSRGGPRRSGTDQPPRSQTPPRPQAPPPDQPRPRGPRPSH